jgi:hypothetical protein
MDADLLAQFKAWGPLVKTEQTKMPVSPLHINEVEAESAAAMRYHRELAAIAVCVRSENVCHDFSLLTDLFSVYSCFVGRGRGGAVRGRTRWSQEPDEKQGQIARRWSH